MAERLHAGTIDHLDERFVKVEVSAAGRLVIALSGAGGDLDGRIAKALVTRGADVRALTRPEAKAEERLRLQALGATVVMADPSNLHDMAKACAGAHCVVSAFNGLREVMIDRQGELLDAAVEAKVRLFISSDYSADFTKTTPGHNRNFDPTPRVRGARRCRADPIDVHP